MFDEILSLVAKKGEERVSLVNNSAYHAQRDHVSKEKTEEFIYPCIRNIGDSTNTPTKIYWSNTNEKGHFGIPKLIWSALGPGIFIDENGDYGMCEHGTAIYDFPENFSNIKKAMQSNYFQKIMKSCKVGGLAGEVYNHKIISLFRKDFWKEFVDE